MDSQESCTNGVKIYIGISVLEAARKRIGLCFDRFENIVVSISGGKDSHVVYELACAEAEKRGRKISVFFLDQEAEYQSSIDVVRRSMCRACVNPFWYQVPLKMTNATSYDQPQLYAWGPGEKWVRNKEALSIQEIEGGHPERFYPFMEWFEESQGNACFLVGLRSEESLNRFGAVTRNPALPGMNWTTKGAGDAVRAYPIYDWAYEDVWTYLGSNKVKYNKIYDYLYSKGASINEMRVSFLLHEHSYKCLTTLQEFEPDTYQKLIDRIGGAHVAALYAKDRVYKATSLPDKFASWSEYRDFLMSQIDTDGVFAKRFKGQIDSKTVHRQQVKQLLIYDTENNSPVINRLDPEDSLKKWMDIL